jgi:hypothetical protein
LKIDAIVTIPPYIDPISIGRSKATLAQIFRCEEFTAAVLEKPAWVGGEISAQKLLLACDEPEIAMGSHCCWTYACVFREYCQGVASGVAICFSVE